MATQPDVQVKVAWIAAAAVVVAALVGGLFALLQGGGGSSSTQGNTCSNHTTCTYNAGTSGGR
jgi:hypothetical protein